MLRLQPAAQTYAWGRDAASSEVAALAAAGGAEVDPNKRYAELWMGTHPTAPSRVAGSGQTLSGWLAAHPQALGDGAKDRFGVDLLFLFKVLSVDTALSIQSHPDKELAARLHAERPEVYKDGNHKPEMALALTDFEALCGFVEAPQLTAALEATPELRGIVGDAMSALVASTGDTGLRKTALKEAFSALMLAEPAAVAAAVQQLVARLRQQEAEGKRPLGAKDALALRLNSQYPEDVGVLASYFLNLVTLASGQAMYLPANEPHAYVSGELVEAMAASDNVIRAGLTPKLRDTGVLCSSLTYSQGMPTILEGERMADGITRYVPPFDEFEVRRIEVPAGSRVQVAADPGPQLLLVQRGRGAATPDSSFQHPEAAGLQAAPELTRGAVFLVPAGTALQLQSEAADRPMLLWSCAVNRRVFAEPAPEQQPGKQEAGRLQEKQLDLVGAA